MTVVSESRARLRRVRASIVRRHHLDIERAIATVDVVLNAHVWELDVALVVARQVMLPGPVLDLQRVAVRPAIAVVTIAIALLQEFLVLRLQVVLEDDAVDVCALVTEAFGFLHVGPIELRVMLQLAWLLDAVMEGLALAQLNDRIAFGPSSRT